MASIGGTKTKIVMKYDRKAQERADRKDFRVKQEIESEKSRKMAIEILRKIKEKNQLLK